ncbi:hypothetical protein JB92DRAFT_3126242 [Gautieria morchelliformis]|nr:hypothetical protein JB92DRAFT_3126242 [Gautieria morchelliformis]
MTEEGENNVDDLPTLLVIRDIDKWSTQNHLRRLPEHRIELLKYERILLQALFVICSIQHKYKLPLTPLQSMFQIPPLYTPHAEWYPPLWAPAVQPSDTMADTTLGSEHKEVEDDEVIDLATPILAPGNKDTFDHVSLSVDEADEQDGVKL